MKPSAHAVERPLLTLIGAGRVGTALGRALRAKGWSFQQVFSRDMRKAEALAAELGAQPVSDWALLRPGAGVYLLAVPDDAIGPVAAALPPETAEGKAVVLHTSGSAALDALGPLPLAGVFYPLQSFSLGAEPDWPSIPLVLEGDRPELTRVQDRMAADLGGPVYRMDSEARTWLHLAAVMANNFANHCFALAAAVLAGKGLPLELLAPLIRETARRAAGSQDPAREQTGPALRGDSQTLERHLLLLEDQPELAALYRDLSASILRLANRIAQHPLSSASDREPGAPERESSAPEREPGA
jgi:predicted short-subunit dehydrogenase-like oxidoreductase (DUF2520 family)